MFAFQFDVLLFSIVVTRLTKELYGTRKLTCVPPTLGEHPKIAHPNFNRFICLMGIAEGGARGGARSFIIGGNDSSD